MNCQRIRAAEYLFCNVKNGDVLLRKAIDECAKENKCANPRFCALYVEKTVKRAFDEAEKKTAHIEGAKE